MHGDCIGVGLSDRKGCELVRFHQASGVGLSPCSPQAMLSQAPLGVLSCCCHLEILSNL